jgi:SAM-dependent methyltransferase
MADAADAFKQFEHAGWEAIPAEYDRGFGSLTVQSVEPMLDACGVEAGVDVLDVACGPGYLAAAAARRGARVIGVDFAEAMLAVARRSVSGVPFQQGDAEALPFEPGRFDALLMNFGLLHLARPDHAIAEAARVLRPGGRAAFTVWAPPSRAVAFGLVLDAVRAHGNPDVPLPPGPPFFRFSDPHECEAATSAAGLRECRVTEVPQRWRLDSGETLFEVMRGGTVRTGGLLQAQMPEALAAIRRAVIEGAERYRAGSGIELPMPSVLFSARKPG